jgi:hypothetical protein
VRRYLWDDEQISRERAEAALASTIEGFEKRGLDLWAVRRKNARS